MRYLTMEEVLELHRLVVAQSGGGSGVRDHNGSEKVSGTESSPREITLQHAKTRLFAGSVLATMVLAIVAVFLHVHSLHAIRRWHPRYPRIVALGTYMPPAPVHALHTYGPFLLLAAAAVLAFISLRTWKNSPSSSAARTLPFIVCAVALLCAVLLYVFALWHLAGVERLVGRPGSTAYGGVASETAWRNCFMT